MDTFGGRCKGCGALTQLWLFGERSCSECRELYLTAFGRFFGWERRYRRRRGDR